MKTFFRLMTVAMLFMAYTVNVGATAATDDYKLFGSDFERSYTFLNETDLYDGFHAAWAWNPSFIRTGNGYCEFYYNQAACDADNRRMRRGCEIACDFSTQSEGWYAYKLYLPEGRMPKNLSGTIITQFFQGGSRNSWAGHLDIDGENLQVQYRHALVDPVKRTVGKLKWDVWQNIIVYFRVGINKKGCIKIWLGEGELVENSPTLVCEGINFGFAHNWIDDNHQDPTPYEVDGKEYTDALGGKWGFYVSSGGDRTMYMANLRVLSGNPEGAFDIINISQKEAPEYKAMVGSLLQNTQCNLLDGWTDTAGVWSVDYSTNMGTDKQNYFQIWTGGKVPTGMLSQKVRLRRGAYSLSVDGIAVSDGNYAAVTDKSVSLFASTGAVSVEIPFNGVKKNPKNVSVNFDVIADEEEVEMGVVVKERSKANWVAVDNFVLTCLSDDTQTGVQQLLQQRVSDHRAYNLAGQMVTVNHRGLVIKDGRKFLVK